MGFLLIFLVGASVQTAAHNELSYMYSERVIAGFGIGGMSSITPVFVSESCPPGIRGRISSCLDVFNDVRTRCSLGVISPDPDGGGDISSASIAMTVMIYLYVIGYSASWGPIPCVYVSEIFPTGVRAYGVGWGSATQWLFNFVVTYITPSAIGNIGWHTFIMFGVLCATMAVWVFVAVRETKGRSLEEMGVLFEKFHAFGSLRDIEATNATKVCLDGADTSDHKEVQATEIENRTTR
jgi:MFS family permease